MRPAPEPVSTGDRSAKIRTYNFPQTRITDHRIDFTVHRLHAILEGDLDELTQALIDAASEERLGEAESGEKSATSGVLTRALILRTPRRLPPFAPWRIGAGAARVWLSAAGIDSATAEADLIVRHVLGLRRVDLPLRRAACCLPPSDVVSPTPAPPRHRVPYSTCRGKSTSRLEHPGHSRRARTPSETRAWSSVCFWFLEDDPEGTVVDVGTGSGAIALALASACPRLHVGPDAFAGAVQVARGDARAIGYRGPLHVFAAISSIRS